MISEALVIISNWCNLNCAHCLQNAGRINPYEVSSEDIISFLDKLPDLTYLKITGGEPLGFYTYDKTYKLCKYALDRGLKVQINTNGTFDIPDFDLDPSKVTFQVSLDGMREEHDNIRGVGTFDKAVNFIRNKKKKGYKVKIMSVIMGQYNIVNFEKFIDFVTIDLFVGLEFQYAGPVGRSSALEKSDLRLKEDDASKLISSRLKNAYIEKCSLRKIKTHCYSIHEDDVRVCIDELGNIIPCPMLQQYKFGTIYNYDEEKVKKEMHDKIFNCTCNYPDGYIE